MYTIVLCHTNSIIAVFSSGILGQVAKTLKAAYYNCTETELKVLEATNEEAWGPHGSAMSEIARLAENPDQYNEIMGILHQRLQEKGDNWRLCYKALLVLDFLCKQGPMRVASDLQRSVHVIESLRDMFEYKDPHGRDQGINVRQRAKELVLLVNSPQRLQEEREKASKNAGKYKGVSSHDMRGGGGGGGFSGSSYGQSGGGGGFGSGGGSSGSGGYGSGGTGSGGYGSGGTGSGGYGSGGFGSGLGGDDGSAEDPFEATRKRIEALKADGSLAEPPRDPQIQAISGTLIDPPVTGDQKKGTKKLSDVKVDPKFISTFSALAPPSGPKVPALAPPKGAHLAPPPSSSKVAPSPTPPVKTATVLDLLGDLEVPAPALTAPPISAGIRMQEPINSVLAFDLLAAAAPAPTKPVASNDGFDFLAGFAPSVNNNNMGAAVASSTPSDFGDIFTSSVSAISAPPKAVQTQINDPFASPDLLKPAQTQVNDPFAMLARAPGSTPQMQDSYASGTFQAFPASSVAAPPVTTTRPLLDDFFASPSPIGSSLTPLVQPQPPAFSNGDDFGTMQQAVGHQTMMGTAPPPKTSDPFAGLGF